MSVLSSTAPPAAKVKPPPVVRGCAKDRQIFYDPEKNDYYYQDAQGRLVTCNPSDEQKRSVSIQTQARSQRREQPLFARLGAPPSLAEAPTTPSVLASGQAQVMTPPVVAAPAKRPLGGVPTTSTFVARPVASASTLAAAAPAAISTAAPAATPAAAPATQTPQPVSTPQMQFLGTINQVVGVPPHLRAATYNLYRLAAFGTPYVQLGQTGVPVYWSPSNKTYYLIYGPPTPQEEFFFYLDDGLQRIRRVVFSRIVNDPLGEYQWLALDRDVDGHWMMQMTRELPDALPVVRVAPQLYLVKQASDEVFRGVAMGYNDQTLGVQRVVTARGDDPVIGWSAQELGAAVAAPPSSQ